MDQSCDLPELFRRRAFRPSCPDREKVGRIETGMRVPIDAGLPARHSRMDVPPVLFAAQEGRPCLPHHPPDRLFRQARRVHQFVQGMAAEAAPAHMVCKHQRRAGFKEEMITALAGERWAPFLCSCARRKGLPQKLAVGADRWGILVGGRKGLGRVDLDIGELKAEETGERAGIGGFCRVTALQDEMHALNIEAVGRL